MIKLKKVILLVSTIFAITVASVATCILMPQKSSIGGGR